MVVHPSGRSGHLTPSPGTILSVSASGLALNGAHLCSSPLVLCVPQQDGFRKVQEAIFGVWECLKIFSKKLMVIGSLYAVSAYNSFYKNTLLSDSGGSLYLFGLRFLGSFGHRAGCLDPGHAPVLCDETWHLSWIRTSVQEHCSPLPLSACSATRQIPLNLFVHRQHGKDPPFAERSQSLELFSCVFFK